MVLLAVPCALLLTVATAALALDSPLQTSRPNPTATTSQPPNFAGIAYPITPAHSCPKVLPATLHAPFLSTAATPVSVTDYQIVGCWEGQLVGVPFIIDLYFSTQVGGGVAIQYGNHVVARVFPGTGPPFIVRFTGADVCWSEQAGAIYGAANIQTGAVMPEIEARQVCPPPLNGAVGGLGSATASGPLPALPSTGGGGMAGASWSALVLALVLGTALAACRWLTARSPAP